MNLLTRLVLEDLIKMELSMMKVSLEVDMDPHLGLEKIQPQPYFIILRIMGLPEQKYDRVGWLMMKVYDGELTITEAIDHLEKERELIV